MRTEMTFQFTDPFNLFSKFESEVGVTSGETVVKGQMLSGRMNRRMRRVDLSEVG